MKQSSTRLETATDVTLWPEQARLVAADRARQRPVAAVGTGRHRRKDSKPCSAHASDSLTSKPFSGLHYCTWLDKFGSPVDGFGCVVSVDGSPSELVMT